MRIGADSMNRDRPPPAVRVRVLTFIVSLAAGWAACGGGEDEAPLAIALVAKSQVQVSDLDRVQIQLHPSRVACDVLLLTGPSYRSPYRLEIDVQAQDETQGTLFDVVAGEYTVDAWGFGSDEGLVHGCTTPVSVVLGELTDVSIELDVVGP